MHNDDTRRVTLTSLRKVDLLRRDVQAAAKALTDFLLTLSEGCITIWADLVGIDGMRALEVGVELVLVLN
jgi:hypothetical protein